MSILQAELPGATVLDLFSGSGALGLEALSRGATHCTFVDKSRSALHVLNRNVDHLGAGPRVTVRQEDALSFVGKTDEVFDIALADPPYGRGLARALFDAFGRRPFAQMLWVEHRKDDDVPEGEGVETRRYGDTFLTGIFHGTYGGDAP